jgi:glycosyltransferase involved in cell wall biosynthesis
MRIHLYQQFYVGPEAPGATQPRKLTRRLAERGHEVLVLACDFNVYSEQTEPAEQCEHPGGGTVTVHRLPAPRRIRVNLRNRLKSYGCFAWRAYWQGLRLPTPDVVLGSIQPLFTGLAALQVARARRAPLLLEVRDLWPDTLVVKGAIRPWQARLLYCLEHRLYRHACRIVSLTPGIKTELLKKGIARERLDVLPNSFDPEAYQLHTEARGRTRQQYGWGESFVAVFTGVHTEVTAVETIVRAAELLKERRHIRFDLFGAGQTKPAAMRLADALGLANIHFHDPVPKAQIPEILTGADVGLMTLFRSPLVHIYFENKLIDYLGAGLPILGAMDGIQGGIIDRFGAGRVVGSLDHAGLARLVEEAASQPEETRRKGRHGREMVERHLLQPRILDQYCGLLEAIVRGQAKAIPAYDPFVE